MIFNLANPYELDKYKEYVNKLYAKKTIVEVKEKKKNRTLPQNKYLHVILSYYASIQGESTEDVKYKYYKWECNKDIYVQKRVNKNGIEVERTRSSAELDTKEMSLSIDRFRNWSASVCGIYLPSPQEHDYIVHCLQVIEENKEFVEQVNI